MARLIAHLLLISFSFCSIASAHENSVNYRLPNTTHPTHYDISIDSRIDLGFLDFSGSVKIGIVVDRTTREIVLHAGKLKIVNVTLSRYIKYLLVPVPLASFKYDEVTEFLKIRTKWMKFHRKDRLLLQIHYSGILRDDNRGFHVTSYVDRDDLNK